MLGSLFYIDLYKIAKYRVNMISEEKQQQQQQQL